MQIVLIEGDGIGPEVTQRGVPRHRSDWREDRLGEDAGRPRRGRVSTASRCPKRRSKSFAATASR